MKKLRLGADVLERTFSVFQLCGRGRAECVAYWVGPTDTPEVVEDLVHPTHGAGPRGYVIESAWVTRFFVDLRRRRQTVRAQVHTHPGAAGHSSTDDDYSLVPAPGFLSLVIPRFALSAPTLRGAALFELQPDGSWSRLDPATVIAS